MTQTGADAMRAGRDAFFAGKSMDDCPYASPNLAAAWRRGITRAAREAVANSIAKVTALRRMPKH
jgi:ribosome modulation factor